MKLPSLQKSIEWLFDNVWDLFAIGLALSLYVKYRTVPPTTNDVAVIFASILGVLAIIAFSGLWQRNRQVHRIEKTIKDVASTLQKHIVEKPSALRFFEIIPVLDPFFKSAHTIDLMGVTLTTTLDRQASNIREAMKKGANIRVILANPSPKSLATKMATLRSEERHVQTYFKKKLDASFEVIEYLNRQFEGRLVNGGNFDVHLIDYAPSFGIVSFDYGQPNGIMFVEIYPHGSGYDTQIAFSLTSQRDGGWFSYFHNQFEDIWRNSVSWQAE
jgi:hypothetical protein